MIAKNIKLIKKNLPSHVKLIVISKTQGVDAIIRGYNAGQRDFGENKVQELLSKAEHLPKDIQWHLVGHLQTNKVKYIAPFIHLIHSVDSLKLIEEIDKHAKQNKRIIACLLQIHIAQESTKFGLSGEEASQILQKASLFKNVKMEGLMGMATFTSDKNVIRSEFQLLFSLYKQFQKEYSSLQYLSMGMSDDYPVAIEEGSNMVRIGTAIFGERVKNRYKV